MFGLLPSPVFSTLLEPTSAGLTPRMLFLPTLATVLGRRIFGHVVWKSWLGRHQSRARALSEEGIFDAIAQLSPTDAAFPSDVKDTLRHIEAAFDLSSVALVVLHRVGWQIKDIYATQFLAATSRPFFDEAIMEIRKLNDLQRNVMRWRYPNRAAFGAGASSGEAEKTPCEAFTSIVWLDDDLGVMLVGRCLATLKEHSPVMRSLSRVARFLALAIAARTRVETLSFTNASNRGYSNTGKDDAGRVAHEFNNLLTSIMGYAEMAADTLSPSSPSYVYLTRIQNVGARAKLVVTQTLNSTRGQNTESDVLFDVVSSTAEILSDLQMCTPAPRTASVRLPDSPVHIYGNPIELQQTLINLCKNAGEAMDEDGSISLSISTIEQHAPQQMTHGRLDPGRYVRISIEDTGHGIADTDLQQIFTPYFTTKSAEKGTGLGLAIVYQTVCRFNGVIDVRSKLGSGTCFQVFFPEIGESVHGSKQMGGVGPELRESGLITARFGKAHFGSTCIRGI